MLETKRTKLKTVKSFQDRLRPQKVKSVKVRYRCLDLTEFKTFREYSFFTLYAQLDVFFEMVEDVLRSTLFKTFDI